MRAARSAAGAQGGELRPAYMAGERGRLTLLRTSRITCVYPSHDHTRRAASFVQPIRRVLGSSSAHSSASYISYPSRAERVFYHAQLQVPVNYASRPRRELSRRRARILYFFGSPTLPRFAGAFGGANYLGSERLAHPVRKEEELRSSPERVPSPGP